MPDRVLIADPGNVDALVAADRESLRALREEGGDSFMEETTISEYARQLLEAQGNRAISAAAQRAVASERRNDKEEARTWRHVEEALKAMRGPRVS
jgi:hypothetical protein